MKGLRSEKREMKHDEHRDQTEGGVEWVLPYPREHGHT